MNICWKGKTFIVLAVLLPLALPVPAPAAPSGAGFTTFDVTAQGCNDSPNGVDCNNYTGKDKVYMSGGPSTGSGLSDGCYYFSVLIPGSQNGGFIDGATGNLSDTTAGGTVGDNGSGDTVGHRTFRVSNSVVTYPDTTCDPDSGGHATGTQPDTGKLIVQLIPYDDTDNTGGVYILAVCQVDATSPSQCKYDAFRLSQSGECTGDGCPTPTPCGGDSCSQAAPLPLIVTKDATPSFDRTFHWTITKDVDTTLVEQFGGSATFHYTVTVSHDDGTDSNWQVGGSISVTNPNPVTDGSNDAVAVDVTDDIESGPIGNLVTDPNATCIVDTSGGTDPAENSSVSLPYTCTYSAAPAASSETNHVHASWLLPASSTVSADFFLQGLTFDTPNNIDECVTVTDTFNGNTTTLGTVCVGDANPMTFTYSHTVTVPSFDCVEYSNTAAFTTNDTGATDSASQTVEVCGPAKTGALTIGFWQNKNGQKIISGDASLSGVCNSGTWLRQYAPFQNLSATATCSQVATYVYNLIKGANAAGASMNAMLKAQMLATALDVYFSDPALGGNKIGAPVPLGGVSIDLTTICKMIDSGGSGTCSGSFESVSSAFGGATTLTVSQMLAYAASQSIPGGAIWYANVKAIQQLAKDAFDAINNQVAFSP